MSNYATAIFPTFLQSLTAGFPDLSIVLLQLFPILYYFVDFCVCYYILIILNVRVGVR